MGDAGSPPATPGDTNGVHNKDFRCKITTPEPIAVVGMGMRLPGGIHTAKGFWKLLIEEQSTR